MSKTVLIKGRMYCYWSKSVYENKASRKFCRLISFNEHYSTVKRLDLSVNNVQRVENKRLKEVVKKPVQEKLFT